MSFNLRNHGLCLLFVIPCYLSITRYMGLQLTRLEYWPLMDLKDIVNELQSCCHRNGGRVGHNAASTPSYKIQ